MTFLSKEQEELAKKYIVEAPLQTLAPFTLKETGKIAVLMNGDVTIAQIAEVNGVRYEFKMVVTATELPKIGNYVKEN